MKEAVSRRTIAVGLGAAAARSPPVRRSGAAEIGANKAVVRHLIVDTQRDGDFALFNLFAVDYVDHTPFGNFPTSRNGTRLIYQTSRKAFADRRAAIHAQVAERPHWRVPQHRPHQPSSR